MILSLMAARDDPTADQELRDAASNFIEVALSFFSLRDPSPSLRLTSR